MSRDPGKHFFGKILTPFLSNPIVKVNIEGDFKKHNELKSNYFKKI